MRPVPTRALLAALTLSLSMLLASPAGAERGRERWRDAEPQGFAPSQSAERRISLDEATRRAQRHVSGRVLNAKSRGDVYEVKMLTPRNEVITVTIDAATGDIIR